MKIATKNNGISEQQFICMVLEFNELLSKYVKIGYNLGFGKGIEKAEKSISDMESKLVTNNVNIPQRQLFENVRNELKQIKSQYVKADILA